jgi:methylthioribose-1-phosphate isomerase
MPGPHNTIPFTTIVFNQKENVITILDQTRLPEKEVYVTLKTIDDIYTAIRTMQVRGAPLIGITAANGIAMASSNSDPATIISAADHLATARPTAVNLAWAVKRMKQKVTTTASTMRSVLVQEALAIQAEDRQACHHIGEYGAALIPDNTAVMVHCNAGALATSGIGTALGIIYTKAMQKNPVRVFANETRPRLQGARLTAWELTRCGIDTCVVCDTMAATYIQQASAVLVGADRIAANGDTANKIGTHNLAILAKHFQIPFYVAAPTSSFDLSCAVGSDIIIEHREENEVRIFNDMIIVPEKASVLNPAFDVTPFALVTAFITERGVIYPPFAENISVSNRAGKENSE